MKPKFHDEKPHLCHYDCPSIVNDDGFCGKFQKLPDETREYFGDTCSGYLDYVMVRLPECLEQYPVRAQEKP